MISYHSICLKKRRLKTDDFNHLIIILTFNINGLQFNIQDIPPQTI